MSNCSLDKKYSFKHLRPQEKAELENKMKYLEKMTWRALANLPRENGLTREKLNSPGYKLINEQDPSINKMPGVDHYYFHFRVKNRGLFRVFGYQQDECFYVTQIDPNSKINHHS